MRLVEYLEKHENELQQYFEYLVLMQFLEANRDLFRDINNKEIYDLFLKLHKRINDVLTDLLNSNLDKNEKGDEE